MSENEHEAEKVTVTDEPGRGHVLDPASPHLSGRLPAGYIDSKTGQLFNTFVVREISGYEEDLLAGKGTPLVRLNQIIANCLVSIGPITDRTLFGRIVLDLPEPDRLALLISLRRASFGDHFDRRIICPNPECREEALQSVNLAELEIKPMQDPMQRSLCSTLSSGTVVRWHVMTGEDSMWMAMQSKKSLEQDSITLSHLARMDAVGEVALNREKNLRQAITTLKAMRARDRQEFRSMVEEYEGDIDTEITYACKKCAHEWKGELQVVSFDFFFPLVRKSR